MKCPVCGAPDSRVLDSRPVEENNSIRRRRECTVCGKRFTTYEVVDTVPLTVIKKDGSREIFDRHKLETGLLKACEKRPVNASAIATAVEGELASRITGEITTREIGEVVMEHLRAVDAVAYVRFASVYREFKDVTTFLDELASVIAEKKSEKKKGGTP
ncbi:MAG: transcriptional repressor NrdR [Clostridia bacterium]|nr:transcriptional repressor NrdR [Clostridia bacterium]